MSWTDPADVLDAWIGEDAPESISLVQTWLDKAEREMRFRVPDLQARIDEEASLPEPLTDLLETAKDVAAAMVMRVFRNPEGMRQRSTTTGPYTDMETFGGDVPGGLGLTGDELAKLQGVRNKGAFSIDLMPSTSPFSRGFDAFGF